MQARGVLESLYLLRNMMAPVNKLPPEIISCVARSVLSHHAIHARKIVPLTHVCRYWRDSIISTPENWTLISNQREGLAALSLERAKAAPLTVRLDVHKLVSTNDPRFSDLLLSHARFIRFLSISGFSMIKELTQALPDFPKSMPNLQSLVLASEGQTNSAQPSDPFDFSAHTLRNLSLRYIPFYPSFLHLRTLTEFTLVDNYFNLHLDVILSFLEESNLLESANFWIRFVEPSLRRSRRGAPVGNGLRRLLISSFDTLDCRALISSIALQRGAVLKIFYHGGNARLADLLSGVSTKHLPNLSSPTFMEYRSNSPYNIRLVGPGGSFLLEGHFLLEDAFKEFHLFTLDSIQELHLEYRAASIPTEFHPFSFPSLEVLVIDHAVSVSEVLFTLLQNPTSSSLKTLALLNCAINEGLMDELAQFTSDRANTTLASLRRIVIIGPIMEHPSAASIERLRERIPVVEVMKGSELPADLKRV